ncbi:TAXI family TRAP transporter solute-binding subunit [Piscinibacter sakaiensis]|uniref:TAXI family TRAP transporter solute-binding subunit n=1 Tax=Piscinibacter sakaiensis TaxID=1547922 RepID=UPI003AAC4ACE
MPQSLRNTLLSIRDLLVTAGPFIALAVGLLVVAYWFLDPTPPKHVVLATGADQGAYSEFGKRYQTLLKQHGIRVELRTTQGAAENLALLNDPESGVDLAFIQGGTDEPRRRSEDDADDRLVSLGSLFYEPVWLFYREDSARRLLGGGSASDAPSLANLHQLQGWRVNIGAPGSGVPQLMDTLLDAHAIAPQSLTLLRQPQTPAVMSLLAGESDALVFASAPESLMVQMLLKTPGIRLMDFAQAEAYSRRFPFLSTVVLPRGVVDLALDQPPADVRLVAPTATLLARNTVHPALIQLFVQAATTIHSESGWFSRKGDFPKAGSTERPLAAEAERFYRNGPPFLQRYLPFWTANLIDRMWVVLVSIIAILIPLSRIVPPLYQFRIRSRVFRWYGQLQTLENEIGQRPAQQLVDELDAIAERVANVHVPLSYADELYALRGHIAMVRRKAAAAEEPQPG